MSTPGAAAPQEHVDGGEGLQSLGRETRAGAREQPDAVVLEVGPRRLTYADLDAAADRVAQRLLDDLGPEHHRIGLRVLGTEALFVAATAIDRAGMVAVPIDPGAPEARIAAIVADVEAPLLLTDRPLLALSGVRAERVEDYVADPPATGFEEPEPAPFVSIAFTSGSTGEPKGIVVPRSREWLWAPDLGARRGVLMAGSVGGIAFGLQRLVERGWTCVAYEVAQQGLAGLTDWIARERITGIFLVPTLVRQLLGPLPDGVVLESVQTVLMSGEAVTWEDVAILRRHLPADARVVNTYGQTETGTVANFVIDAGVPLGEGRLPIGTLVPTKEVVLLDPEGRPVGPGEAGEIVVRTTQRGLGYWRRPELTAEVFVEGDGGYEIRTRDAGRWGADGLLQHLGRLDHLVKVAGKRIELGEVELGLAALDGVADAVATTYEDAAGATRLTAHVVAEAGRVLHPSVLRTELARRLPAWMLPDGIDVLDALPRLPGGKVDRRGLPERRTGRPADAASSVPPSRGLEADLVAIWSEVLGVTGIGVHDDFFALGGDSLRAARVFAAIEERLGLDRSISLLVESPTIAELACVLETDADAPSTVVPVQLGGSEPPLFVVHDATGELFFARALATHLGPDRPVYGLQASSSRSIAAAHRTVEEIAAHHLREMRRVWPGPYMLYGPSFGGLVVLEMGRQLQAAGDEVGLLALGDTHVPLPRAYHRRHRARAWAAEMRRIGPGGWPRRTAGWVKHAPMRVRRARARRDWEAGRAPMPPGERRRFVLRHYGGVVERYTPTSLEVPVLLLRAEDPRGDGEPDGGWGPLTPAGLRVVAVPGTHTDIGHEPYVRHVAAALGTAMAEHGT